jgi:KRAB domain-containing zinc finger protein
MDSVSISLITEYASSVNYCPLCDFSAPSELDLQCHVELDHAGEFQMVPGFNSEDRVPQIPEELHQCSQCSFTGTMAHLTEHVKNVHKQNTDHVAQELVNHVDDSSSSDLTSDGDTTNNVSSMELACDGGTADGNDFITDMSAEFNPKFKCTLCNYDTAYRTHLITHVARTHGCSTDDIAEMLYSCDQCQYTSMLKENLMNHVYKIHGKSDRKQENTELKPALKISMLKVNLRNHVNNNVKQGRKQQDTDLKPATKMFNCDHCDCDYTSKFKRNLKSHVNNIHAKPGQKQENTHFNTGLMLYNCDHCDYTSKFRGNLKSHIYNIHGRRGRNKQDTDFKSAPKLYNCDQCDYTSKCKFYLKKHVVNIHVLMKRTRGGRPKRNDLYLCTNCGFNGPSISSLNDHIQQCWNHKCTLCDFASVAKSDLDNHITQQHGNQSNTEPTSNFFTDVTEKELARNDVFANHDTSKELTCDGDGCTTYAATKEISVVGDGFTTDGATKDLTCDGNDFNKDVASKDVTCDGDSFTTDGAALEIQHEVDGFTTQVVSRDFTRDCDSSTSHVVNKRLTNYNDGFTTEVDSMGLTHDGNDLATDTRNKESTHIGDDIITDKDHTGSQLPCMFTSCDFIGSSNIMLDNQITEAHRFSCCTVNVDDSISSKELTSSGVELTTHITSEEYKPNDFAANTSSDEIKPIGDDYITDMSSESNLRYTCTPLVNTIKRYNCDKCDVATKREEDLEKHNCNAMKQQDTAGRIIKLEWYNCDKCAYTTKCEQSFKKHSHNDSVLNSQELEQHDAAVKPPDQQWYNCEHCVFSVNCKKSLENHVRDIHVLKKRARNKPKNLKLLLCTYCDFNCTTIAGLNGHIRKCRPKLFLCTYCDFNCTSIARLNCHIRKCRQKVRLTPRPILPKTLSSHIKVLYNVQE